MPEKKKRGEVTKVHGGGNDYQSLHGISIKWDYMLL